MSQKQLIAHIVSYLNECLGDGSVPKDDHETLEVGIDAIKEVFGVQDVTPPSTNLLELYSKAAPAPPAESDRTKSESDEKELFSEEDKSIAEAHKLEGNRFMAQKLYTEAVEAYTKAIARNPTSAVFWSNRSAAYSQLNQPTQAVEDAHRTIALDPEYSRGYSRLGLALYSVGDIKGSLAAYEKGLEVEGSSPSEGMRRGYETVKRRLQEQQQAEEEDPDIELESGELESPPVPKSEPAAAGADANPFGNLGGLGNLGSMLPNLGEFMKNPAIKQMADKVMSDPSMLANLMNSETAKKLSAHGPSGLGSPSELAKDPAVQSLLEKFMGSGQ